MNWQAFKTELVKHYAAMEKVPGAREAALHSVIELARDYPQEFGDLRELVNKELAKK